MGYKLVDAREKILGRICSVIAKQTLLGEKFVIINAKDAKISGHRDAIIQFFLQRQEKHTLSQPRNGPFWPHRPDHILRRAIRNMLPRNDRGLNALKRVQVFISDIPDHLKKKYTIDGELKIANADATKIKRNTMSLEDLSTKLGWSGRGML